jgi:hypothetical protein
MAPLSDPCSLSFYHCCGVVEVGTMTILDAMASRSWLSPLLYQYCTVFSLHTISVERSVSPSHAYGMGPWGLHHASCSLAKRAFFLAGSCTVVGVKLRRKPSVPACLVAPWPHRPSLPFVNLISVWGWGPGGCLLHCSHAVSKSKTAFLHLDFLNHIWRWLVISSELM